MFKGLAVLFVTTILETQVFALDENDLEKQSYLIAKLLVSCRDIVAQNQDLINGPKGGEKNFTGDVYVNKIKDHFKNETGIEISVNDASSHDNTNKALYVLLSSAKEVIDKSQNVINMKGIGYKHIVPAIVGRRSAFKYNRAMGAGYYLKQTSLKFRNPASYADAFERKLLRKFEGADYPKGKGIGEVIINSDGSKVYRYVLPVYISPSCLQCHGGEDGEKDITGRTKECYKLGDVIGGISVMVPYQ